MAAACRDVARYVSTQKRLEGRLPPKISKSSKLQTTMNHGKNICNQLKAIRRNIANENNIDLEITECTYKGECLGTCPQCEAEVRYLEKELARRLTLGKAATVAGIALTLGTPAVAQVEDRRDVARNVCTDHRSQNTDHWNCDKPVQGVIPQGQKVPDTVAEFADSVFTIRGTVTDAKTHEPVAFASVALLQGDRQIGDTQTDINGRFEIRHHGDVDKTKMNIRISCFNYEKSPEISFDGEREFKIALEPTAAAAEVKVEAVRVPIIEGGAPVVMGTRTKTDTPLRTKRHEKRKKKEDVVIQGTVIDLANDEPIPFANVVLKQKDSTLCGTQTDFDGNFLLKKGNLTDKENITIVVSSVGYKTAETPWNGEKSPMIKLKLGGPMMLGLVITHEHVPLINIGDGSIEYEQDGIKVKVQY